MAYRTLLIISSIAAIIHIMEEYKCGWIEWASGFVAGITRKQFIVINILFLLLCIAAISVAEKNIIFSSSIFSLLLINTIIHIAPTIRQKRYNPGLFSAVLLYIPTGIAGYIHLYRNHLITNQQLLFSALLALLWMSVPFLYQALRIMRKKENISTR